MKRLRMLGLALLAAFLPACSAPTISDVPATRSLASRPLLRLASFEDGSKADIVTHFAGDPADTQHRLTPDDQVAKVTALWHAINDGAVGRQVVWSNVGTGSHGYAEVMREVPIPESDRVCREYREAFVVAGRSETELGQACQLRDGSWWKIQG